jgi:hypothetical protein
MYPILCVSVVMEDPKMCKIFKTIVMKISLFYERLKSTFKYIYILTQINPSRNYILVIFWNWNGNCGISCNAQ